MNPGSFIVDPLTVIMLQCKVLKTQIVLFYRVYLRGHLSVLLLSPVFILLLIFIETANIILIYHFSISTIKEIFVCTCLQISLAGFHNNIIFEQCQRGIIYHKQCECFHCALSLTRYSFSNKK